MNKEKVLDIIYDIMAHMPNMYSDVDGLEEMITLQANLINLIACPPMDGEILLELGAMLEGLDSVMDIDYEY